MSRSLILGSGPKATALTLTIDATAPLETSIANSSSSWIDPTQELSFQTKKTRRETLRECEAAVSLPSYSSRPSEIVPVIHRLRTTFRWEGHFIAVVADTEANETLRNTSLTGDLAERTHFQNVPAHTALTEPVHLPKVLNILVEPGHLACENWFLNLLRTSSLQRLSEVVNQGTTAIEEGHTGKARKATSESISLLEEIDWLSVIPASIYHDQKIRERVEKLTSRPPETAPLTLEECYYILDEVGQLLSSAPL